jgi:hypothetical protein
MGGFKSKSKKRRREGTDCESDCVELGATVGHRAKEREGSRRAAAHTGRTWTEKVGRAPLGLALKHTCTCSLPLVESHQTSNKSGTSAHGTTGTLQTCCRPVAHSVCAYAWFQSTQHPHANPLPDATFCLPKLRLGFPSRPALPRWIRRPRPNQSNIRTQRGPWCSIPRRTRCGRRGKERSTPSGRVQIRGWREHHEHSTTWGPGESLQALRCPVVELEPGLDAE